jgi:hypothetical protein
MQKPGASPQENAGSFSSAEGAKSQPAKIFCWRLVVANSFSVSRAFSAFYRSDDSGAMPQAFAFRAFGAEPQDKLFSDTTRLPLRLLFLKLTPYK